MESVTVRPVCVGVHPVRVDARDQMISVRNMFRDFVKLAESYGAYGIRVEKEEDIDAAFAEAKKHTDAPTIIEFMIATDELVLPMVKSGNPMSEMILK